MKLYHLIFCQTTPFGIENGVIQHLIVKQLRCCQLVVLADDESRALETGLDLLKYDESHEFTHKFHVNSTGEVKVKIDFMRNGEIHTTIELFKLEVFGQSDGNSYGIIFHIEGPYDTDSDVLTEGSYKINYN